MKEILNLDGGDNSAQGMMDNFWRVILRGGGCTHGETYIDKPDTDRPIWWAHGGKLYGKSQKKINFLCDLLHDNGFDWVKPQATSGPTWELAVGSTPDEKKWLVYFGIINLNLSCLVSCQKVRSIVPN